MYSAAMKYIHSDLQRISLSQRWILTNFNYHLRGFITSTLLTRSTTSLRAPADSSASSPLHAHSAPSAVIPKVPKQKSFTYHLFSVSCLQQAVVAFTTQPSVTENTTERQYAMQTIRPLGVWGREKATSPVGAVQKNKPAVWIEIMSN